VTGPLSYNKRIYWAAVLQSLRNNSSAEVKNSVESTLFLTSALEGGEVSASRPGRTLPPGKTRYPLYRRLGGHQGRSGRVRKISPPPHRDFFFLLSQHLLACVHYIVYSLHINCSDAACGYNSVFHLCLNHKHLPRGTCMYW
jgi:hypothetical protein